MPVAERRRIAAVTLALALSAVGAGCARAQDVAADSPTAPRSPTVGTTTPPTASSSGSPPTSTAPTTPPLSTPTMAGIPVVGGCHKVDPGGFASHRDGSAATDCGAAHTAETFAVFAEAVLPDADRLHHIRRLCAAQFASYVGAPPTVSRVGLTLMEPSTTQIDDGETWVRCDAIQSPAFNVAVGVSRVGSLRGALSQTVPVALRGCANHWPKVYQAVHFTSCRAPHQAELVPEARILGGPDAPYPGRPRVRATSRAFCEDAFQRYVTSTTHFYYYYPTAASWASSTHATTCWAVDPSGPGLPPL